MELVQTPEPPYYSVIFSSIKANDDPAYQELAIKMDDLVRKQPGFLGMDSARDQLGITISYWESLEAIKQWKMNADHMEAQLKGKSEWYKSFSVRIAKVEREYSFGK